jgi:hypothetical protein
VHVRHDHVGRVAAGRHVRDHVIEEMATDVEVALQPSVTHQGAIRHDQLD